MDMTAEEIVRHYQQAANKIKDIGVLAELNATDKASIKAILIDAGVLAPEKKSCSAANQKELAAAIAEMLAEKIPHKEIAEELGCTVKTVENHAKRLKKTAEPSRAEPSRAEPSRAGAPAHQKGEGQAKRQQSRGGYFAGGTRGGPGQREGTGRGPMQRNDESRGALRPA